MKHSSEIHGDASDKAQEYLEGWKRTRAEMANMRKRTAEANQSMGVLLKRSVISSFLPLIDNLQAVINHVPKDLESNPWTQGVLHIARQTEQILAEHGVTAIQETGTPFDPRLHEAIDKVKAEGVLSDMPSGSVATVIQPGYRLGETVIRPAKVNVIE